MKQHKIYYYISMWTNGNMVAGYRIEKDTNLEKLGKKWLGERSCDVTPIMEGIEFKRPTPKPDQFTAMWGRLPIIVNQAEKKAKKK
jgi:hypothetical protein